MAHPNYPLRTSIALALLLVPAALSRLAFGTKRHWGWYSLGDAGDRRDLSRYCLPVADRLILIAIVNVPLRVTQCGNRRPPNTKNNGKMGKDGKDGKDGDRREVPPILNFDHCEPQLTNARKRPV
jgi:hypothetical protein